MLESVSKNKLYCLLSETTIVRDSFDFYNNSSMTFLYKKKLPKIIVKLPLASENVIFARFNDFNELLVTLRKWLFPSSLDIIFFTTAGKGFIMFSSTRTGVGIMLST